MNISCLFEGILSPEFVIKNNHFDTLGMRLRLEDVVFDPEERFVFFPLDFFLLMLARSVRSCVDSWIFCDFSALLRPSNSPIFLSS